MFALAESAPPPPTPAAPPAAPRDIFALADTTPVAPVPAPPAATTPARPRLAVVRPSRTKSPGAAAVLEAKAAPAPAEWGENATPQAPAPEPTDEPAPEPSSQPTPETAPPETAEPARAQAIDPALLDLDMPAPRRTRDHHLNPTDDLAPTSPRDRAERNLAALRLLKQLEAEGRPATTPAERDTLARYSGWGALPGVFDRSPGTWEATARDLRALVSDEEWQALQASTTNAHYTSLTVVDAVWQAAVRLGVPAGPGVRGAGALRSIAAPEFTSGAA